MKWVQRRSTIKESDMLALNFRVSSIRKVRPQDDLQSTDAPMLWERKSSGYRIVSLKLNKFMQSLNFVLVHRRPKYSLNITFKPRENDMGTIISIIRIISPVSFKSFIPKRRCFGGVV